MKIQCRKAAINDLPAIIRMLADDFLGGQRERFEEPLGESYRKAFREIEDDPNNELVVAVLSSGDENPAAFTGNSDKVVGAFQLTFTPSLSFQGGKRATIESVRVDAGFRGQGIGDQMMRWAIGRAKEKGCVSMQLTTNLERKDAHRFYERLGFHGTHLGMKLKL